jgi:hypothetical protein
VSALFGITMKTIRSIIACAAILAIAVAICLVMRKPAASAALPPNAFVVSVRAGDASNARLLPFEVTTSGQGGGVLIQDIALHSFTNSTVCEWVDWTTRTIRVESPGYEPREYTVTGKQDIIALLTPL